MIFYSSTKQPTNKPRFVWKTIPSEARVTWDAVSGLYTSRDRLSGRQYHIIVLLRLRLSAHALKRFTDRKPMRRILSFHGFFYS